MKSLRSKRLSLEPFAASDADELFLIRGDSEAMEFWDWPADATREDTHAIARIMLDDMQSGAVRIWTARRIDDQAFVGVVDLTAVARNEADLGFMIRRDFWGNGYAAEAASAVMSLAWSEGIKRLAARTHSGNLRSRRLLEKLGFAIVSECEVEVRPGMEKRCAFFSLGNPDQGSSSLSQ